MLQAKKFGHTGLSWLSGQKNGEASHVCTQILRGFMIIMRIDWSPLRIGWWKVGLCVRHALAHRTAVKEPN